MIKKFYKPVLWVLLICFLALSYEGFGLRTSIEKNNTSMLTVADYYDFKKLSESANTDIYETLLDLKSQGVSFIGVKEVSLRELALAGRVTVEYFYEFQSYNQLHNPKTIWTQAEAAIKNSPVSNNNLVVATGDGQTASFVRERLLNRFSPEKIIYFNYGEQYYFIINAELSYLDRRKDIPQEFDTPLGFDPQVLDDLFQMGFSAVLRPENTSG
ncbi:MAG: DUF5693 family protein, partial [Syntrophomonadaceae bacterium]|nr:DUF5693 family protein [Syntrophomonadaceae bacterium]